MIMRGKVSEYSAFFASVHRFNEAAHDHARKEASASNPTRKAKSLQ